MKKSDINPMPPYFDCYINLVDDVELQQGVNFAGNFDNEMAGIRALGNA